LIQQSPRVAKLLTSLARITPFIAGFSLLLVALSASHELGYFAYLGANFFQSFVSVTDYFSNAILWLPFAVATAAGWWNWDWLWESPPKPQLKNWKTWIFPGLMLIVPIVNFVFLEEGIPALYLISFVYFWILFGDHILPSPKQITPVAAEIRKLLKIGIPVCAAMFTLGYINAQNDMKSFSGAYIIRLKDGDRTVLQIPIRNFSRGILVRDVEANSLVFIRWENIDSIAKIYNSHTGQTLSCIWFGISCKGTNSPL
jgi:hypothetical protein